MSRISTLLRGAGRVSAVLAGCAAHAHYPVHIINPTDQPWRLVCTKPFLPLRVTTLDAAGGLVVKEHKAFPNALLAPLTPEFNAFRFEFVIPANATAKLETTAPVQLGRAEFLLVDHQGRELDDSHVLRETVCYWVAPDEQSRRRDALGRPLTVGRIGYDHRAPAGIMAANHRTPATLVFAGDSWGRTGTRAFPGLEATPARDREPEEGKQPTAGTAKEPRRPAPAGAGLVESKLNTLPAIQPAKAQPPAPKAAQPRIPRKNQENVAP